MARAPAAPLLEAPRFAGRLRVHNPRRPLRPDDLAPPEGSVGVPRLVRFVADDGSPHLGLVTASAEGKPRQLLDLTARHGLGPGLLDFFGHGGLAVAEQELAAHVPEDEGRDLVTLAPEELPARLLSPVDIDADTLERGARLVVGFGLTFREHQAETRGPRPIVFPKPVVPTGAYAPVVTGDGEGVGGPLTLLDYELELGCVTLRDIDLDRLEAVDPAEDFGYLVINDVTAREPILHDRRKGFTRAKGRPTYLPAGPWVVPGRHFVHDPPARRRMVLTVDERSSHGRGSPAHAARHTLRQDALLGELTLGVEELLALVARQRTLTMQGRDGRAWPVSVLRGGRHLIPAGSLLLTGTPGGTAIRSPGLAERWSLLVHGLRHLRWPSDGYRRHLHEHHRAFGFLSPGDRVSSWITGLGRQEWQVT